MKMTIVKHSEMNGPCGWLPFWKLDNCHNCKKVENCVMFESRKGQIRVALNKAERHLVSLQKVIDELEQGLERAERGNV